MRFLLITTSLAFFAAASCKDKESNQPYKYWKPPPTINGQYGQQQQEVVAEGRSLHSQETYNDVYRYPEYDHTHSYGDYGDYQVEAETSIDKITNVVSQGLQRLTGNPLSNDIDRQFFGIPFQFLLALAASGAAFGGIAIQTGVVDAIINAINPTTTTTAAPVVVVTIANPCASVTCSNGMSCVSGTCVCGSTSTTCSGTTPLCANNAFSVMVCQCDTTSCAAGETCTDGVCKCGTSSECTGTSNICQASTNTCLCGTGSACTTDTTPSCLTTGDIFTAGDTGSTCKACTKTTGTVTAGDATTQGSCPLASDICLSTGKCDCQKDSTGGGAGDGLSQGTCTDSQETCLSDGTCKCQKVSGVVGNGDGTTQGTCSSSTNKCHDDGTCAICRESDSSGCDSDSNICTSGKCVCGSTGAACDTSSTTPSCLLSDKSFAKGDVSATCAKCTKVAGVSGDGDGTTQGSCKTSTDLCQSDGSCKECTQDSDCTGKKNANICSSNVCKCGSGDACDSTSATPTCLKSDNTITAGDTTSTCSKCRNDASNVGDGSVQGFCPLSTDKCLATGKCGCTQNSECTNAMGANVCDTGVCKCGSGDVCDTTGTTPVCTTSGSAYTAGDTGSTCKACVKTSGNSAAGDGSGQGTCPANKCHSDGSCNVCVNSVISTVPTAGSAHSGCDGSSGATPICDHTVSPRVCKACVTDVLPNVLSCASTANGAKALGAVGGGADQDGEAANGGCATGTKKGCECTPTSNAGCPTSKPSCSADGTAANLNTCA